MSRLPRLMLLTLAAALLSGFAEPPPYSRTGFHPALKLRNQAAFRCEVNPSLHTTRAKYDCVLAADRAFAATIHARDAKLMAAYVEASRRIAADRDSGKLSKQDMTTRYQRAYQDYVTGMQKDYAAWRVRKAQSVVGPLFVKDALPRALADRQRTQDQCVKKKLVGAPLARCWLAADRTLATAIQLKDMEIYNDLAFEVEGNLSIIANADYAILAYKNAATPYYANLERLYAANQARQAKKP